MRERRGTSGNGGFTLVELLIVIAIIAVASSMGIVMYRNAVVTAKDTVVVQELNLLQREIDRYIAAQGRLPADLEEAGWGQLTDPWGVPYHYVNFALLPGGGPGAGGRRKDRFTVPVNTRYDLFSSGPDGEWQVALTDKASHDDFLRANDGEYIGRAVDY